MQMKISAKNLGALSGKNFCERCFWISMHEKLPYQIFPGIFSSIDVYTKYIVESYFEKEEVLPVWLSSIGKVTRIFKNTKELLSVKGHKNKKFLIDYKNVTLTGVPDAIFESSNKKIIIVDYKTARYTEGQDTLMPIYNTQLNAYAYITEKLGLGIIEKLYLVYFEPPESKNFAKIAEKYTTKEGFEMPFVPKIHEIKKDTEIIEKLMDKAYEIYTKNLPPERNKDCKNCTNLNKICNII